MKVVEPMVKISVVDSNAFKTVLQKYISDLERQKMIANRFQIATEKVITPELARAKKFLERATEEDAAFERECDNIRIKVIEHWKFIVQELAQRQLVRIKDQISRKSSQDFTELKQTLEKILDDIEDLGLSIEQFEKIYENLERLTEQIDGKILAEKNENWKFWIGLSVGAILGVIGTLITDFLGKHPSS
ncbi:MAG: hypothetical protein WC861_01590 [Candidatus Micrarchaeia archaeon]|jgi:hypothetical protein